jgi:hypothetical protein
LELKVLEPSRITYYLKLHEFLEYAKCTGDCNKTIKAIHTPAPKASLHYCDVGKKGFDAPEEDTRKAAMECGLVLCIDCYGKREARYRAKNTEKGGSGRRTSRRRRN